jgi:hypothetical protein
MKNSYTPCRNDARSGRFVPGALKNNSSGKATKVRSLVIPLLLLLLSFGSISASAQSAGNYTFSMDSVSSLALDAYGNPVDMNTGVTLLHGPDIDTYTATVQNIGFTFYLMGTAYTQFSANPDGQIRLGSTAITGHTSSAANGAAFLVANNVDSRTAVGTGAVNYKIQGTAPNRVLIVEWKDIRINWNAAGTTHSSFQTRVYETTNIVEYVYGTMWNASTSAQSSSIGFSVGSTAGLTGQVLTISTTPTYSSTATSFTTTSFPASSAMNKLNSTANGTRKRIRFTPSSTVSPANPTALAFTNITATAGTVSWTDNSTNEILYIVTRATDAAFTQNVNTTAVSSTTTAATGAPYTLDVTGLAPSTIYYYRVQAVNEGTVPLAGATGTLTTGAPMVYTWNVVSGAWTAASSWLPARTTADVTDILMFSNASVGTTQTATGVPAQTIRRLVVDNGITANLQASATSTLTIASDGTASDELFVAAGSSLISNGTTAALTITYSGAGSTGTIAGNLEVTSPAGGTVANTISFTGGTTSVTTVTGTLSAGQSGGTGVPVLTGSTATLIIAPTGIYNHKFVTSSGTIPTATWQAGSNCNITGYTTATSGPSGFAQTFSNITWNCPSQTGGINCSGTVPNSTGTVTMASTGSGELRFTSTTTYTISWNNFQQTGGSIDLFASASSNTATINISGTFNQSAGSFKAAGGNGTTLNFNGTSSQNVSFFNAAPVGAVIYRFSNPAGVNLAGTGTLTSSFNINSGGGVRISTRAVSPINTALTLVYSTTGTTLAYDTTGSYTMRASEFPATSGPANLTIAVGAGNVITMPASFGSRSLSPSGANGVLTMTSGDLDLNSNTFTLGTSASFPGTLTWTAGAIRVTTGSLTRYFGTTGLPTTAVTGVGFFPLASGTNNRSVSVYGSAQFTTGGSMTVSHANVPGTSATAVTDGTFTVDRNSNSSWTITNSGLALAGNTIALRLTAGNLVTVKTVSNLRLIQAGAVSGTHVAGAGTFPNYTVARSGMSLSDISQIHYVGFADSDAPVYSLSSGSWDDASTWSKGWVPTCTDSVVIAPNTVVTVSGAVTNAKAVAIAGSGTLEVSAGTFTVGCTNNNSSLINTGTLTVSGGTLNVNGYFNMASGSTFNHSNGNINVDGNAGGVAANSVPGGTTLVTFTATAPANLNLTGGVFTIVDPHVSTTATASNAFSFSSPFSGIFSTSPSYTLRFGDGISADTSANVAGFGYAPWSSTAVIKWGNVIINGPAAANRNVRPAATYGALIAMGDLTINAGGELYQTATGTPGAIVVGGNVQNDGRLTTLGTLYMGQAVWATSTTLNFQGSAAAQTIGGAGVFRNAATATANISSLGVNNINPSGVTISLPLSVSGTLTLTQGKLHTSAANMLTIGTATAGGTVTGGSDTSFIEGPVTRTFASSRTASGTYSGATLFPVGKGTAYMPVWIDPSTTSGGAIAVTGEAFGTNTGTMRAGVTSLSASRWEAAVTSGLANFTNAFVQLGDSVHILSTNKILQSTSASGVYDAIIPATQFNTSAAINTIRTATQILAADYAGYFAYGDLTPCVVPADQPTAFAVTGKNATSFTGSFTAATSAPSNYLVVRYTSGATPVAPVDFKTYTVASALGTGTVIANGSAVSFTQTGLTANTTYDYYIYSFNNSGCYGPVYDTITPLMAAVTTCATTPSSPTVAAHNITDNGFRLAWVAPVPGATFEVDLSTSSTFASLVPGYSSFSTGTDTTLIVSGLLSDSIYYARVRTIVGGACVSSYSSSVSVKVLCTAVSMFTENFDGVPTGTVLPSCFTKVGTAGTVSIQTANNASAPNCLYIYSSSTSNRAVLALPPVDNAGTGMFWLKFKARANVTVGENIEVGYLTNPSNAASFVPVTSVVISSLTYATYTADLGTAPDTNKVLAIRASGSPANSVLIDDISWEAKPACMSPVASSIVVSDITSSSAVVSWKAPFPAPSGYDYYVSPSNVAPTPSTSASGSVFGSDTSATITSLPADSVHYVWVRGNCGTAGDWTSVPVSFRTACNPVTVLPYIENFNGVTVPAIPACTKVLNVNNDANTWATAAAPAGITGFTGNVLRYAYNTTNAANDWFFTAPLSLSAGTSYRLTFSFATNSAATYYEKLRVSYGTSMLPASMTTVLFDSTFIGTAVRVATIDFVPPATGMYYLGYHAYSDADRNSLYVDNIKLDLTPSCSEPTQLTHLPVVRDDSATISWKASVSLPVSGYDYYISTSRTAPTSGTAPTVNGIMDTLALIGGLSADTKYYVWVRSNCAGDGYSNWTAQPDSFTTRCAPAATITENFDGVPVSAMPSCWSKVGTQGSVYLQTANAFSTPNCLYFYSTSATTRAVVSLPPVDNAGAGTHWLKMKARASATVGAVIQVGYLTNPADPATFVKIDSVTINSLTYNDYYIDLGTAAGAYTYIALRHTGVPANSVLIDNVSWEAKPACMFVTGVKTSQITDLTALARWNKPSVLPSAGYEYYVSTSNIAPNSGTSVTGTATDTFATITTGLTPATKHFIWVRSNCGGSGTSEWSALADSFTTKCSPAATITENFDGVVATAWPACWSKVGTAGTANLQTGNNLTAPNCLYITSSSATNRAVVALPPVSNAGAGTHWLHFKARASVTTGGVVQVGYLTDASDASTFVSVKSFTANSLVYNEFGIDLGTAPGAYTTLAFRHTGVPANAVLIDNVSWDVKPSCVFVSGVKTQSTTANSAFVTWDKLTPAPVSGFEYYVSTSNIAPTTGSTATGSSADTFATVSPLSANTKHFIWVRSNCGVSNGTSEWTFLPDSFTTKCAPSGIPYTQDFDAVTVPNLPVCTERQDLNGGSTWTTVAAPAGYTGNTLRYSYSTSLPGNDWFYTNGLSLTGGTSYRLTFKYSNSNSGSAESMKVAFGNAAVNTAMTNVLMDLPSISNATVTTASIDFTPATTGVYYIGFHSYSAANIWYLNVDDIAVNFSPTCITPTALVVRNTSSSTAVVSWTRQSTPPSGGYEYYVDGNNSTPGAAATPTGTVLPTDTFISLSSLATAQNYYVWVRNNCGSGVYSAWSATPALVNIPLVVATLPYTENFDGAGVTGWSSSVVAGTASNPWVSGTPSKTNIAGPYSAPNAWVTGLTGNYTTDQNAALLSPSFNFSSQAEDPILRFYHNFYTESGYDGGVVEISVDGGSWRRLDSTIGTGTTVSTPNSYAWYNSASANLEVGPRAFSGTSSTVHAGTTAGWLQSATRLTGAAGHSNVRIRFRFVSDNLLSYEGWAVDNIEVVAVNTPSVTASSVVVSNITNVTSAVSWTRGNGAGRIVVARLASTAAVAPANGINYNASATLKSGDSTGTGNYIVYKGADSVFTASGLSELTSYTFDVYEFNGKYMHVKFAAASSQSGTTLPVELVAFTAAPVKGDVSLDWSTASELNSYGFVVERSADGRVFEKAGFVPAKGTSNELVHYHLTDFRAFDVAAANTLYYRLRMQDADGKETMSKVLTVTRNGKMLNAVEVYPNPFTSNVNVSLVSAGEGTYTMEVADLQGKTVSVGTVAIQKGMNRIPLDDLSGLQAGVYMLRLTGTETITVKLIKTN